VSFQSGLSCSKSSAIWRLQVSGSVHLQVHQFTLDQVNRLSHEEELMLRYRATDKEKHNL
jgi:hypothetical protein